VLSGLASLKLEQLSASQIQYSIPPRLTTAFVAQAIEQWLTGSNGGKRLENVAVALLRFAGKYIAGGWDSVDSHHVNDPRPYDAVCNRRGLVVALGECKDQPVTGDHVSQLAREMANFGATRGYLFTLDRWLAAAEDIVIAERIRERSIYGYRIDVLDVIDAVRTWLPFLDQADDVLPAFMRELTTELDQHGLLEDRRALATILDGLASPQNET
jgi:hypothetical protein